MDDTSSSQTIDPSPPSPKQPPLYTPLAPATLERINTWRTTNLLAATCTCTDPPTPLPHPTSTFLASDTNFWHGTWTYRRHPAPPPPGEDWQPDTCARCARLGATAPATPDPAPEQRASASSSSSVGGALSRIASLCLSPAKRASASAKPGPGSGSGPGRQETAKPSDVAADPDTDEEQKEKNATSRPPDAGNAPLKSQLSSSSLFRRMRLRKWSFERNPAKMTSSSLVPNRAIAPSGKTPRVTAAAVAAVGAPAKKVGSEYNPSTTSTTSNPGLGVEDLQIKRAKEGDARLARARELLEKKKAAEA
ncbi:hypothetical protein ACHAQH_003259 [Verticillium albo-atrum]